VKLITHNFIKYKDYILYMAEKKTKNYKDKSIILGIIGLLITLIQFINTDKLNDLFKIFYYAFQQTFIAFVIPLIFLYLVGLLIINMENVHIPNWIMKFIDEIYNITVGMLFLILMWFLYFIISTLFNLTGNLHLFILILTYLISFLFLVYFFILRYFLLLKKLF